MPHRLHGLAAAVASVATVSIGVSPPATAQTRADPADPRAPARALGYRSAFADYKPYQEITPGDWRRLNDMVGAAALKPSASPSAAPIPAPAPSGGAPVPATKEPSAMPGSPAPQGGTR